MVKEADKNAKKEAMKSIVLALHKGLSIEDAKARFEKDVGDIGSTEIAELEQGLINDGLSPDEIKKFCNVHALIFQSALEKSSSEGTFPSHPVNLFRQENRAAEKLIKAIRENKKGDAADIKKALLNLADIKIHYERKEQLLFPYLEKKDFTGPSMVMWGKDNEIRDMFKAALLALNSVVNDKDIAKFKTNHLGPLLEEIEGMIFKEENILFSTALEKLESGDWMNILRESDEYGYAFIEKPAETDKLLGDLSSSFKEEPVVEGNIIKLPTGTVSLSEMTAMLNVLRVDLTFVDKDDKLAYFSDNADRVFKRSKSAIGRKVQQCHPPQSLEKVEAILSSFKHGYENSADFWISMNGKDIYIEFFAVRDTDGAYLGTLEVAQDITKLKKLKGEKRL
ncbi:MAG: DUF438 domain-containing protein [Chloroflexi bacterium]|jgi:uncharacterized protein|nr:DUF438 domain-containing protein [Chloroflexota bacterium]MBT7080113.1 DUF438 domain-containing protein [Chloroflexota bacterium]MBT7290191.1 DUF438 domain-containing protein [Chloroflexota bacterium]